MVENESSWVNPEILTSNGIDLFAYIYSKYLYNWWIDMTFLE